MGSACKASIIREKVPGQVNEKGNRMGLLNASAFGMEKELEPSTGVRALP